MDNFMSLENFPQNVHSLDNFGIAKKNRCAKAEHWWDCWKTLCSQTSRHFDQNPVPFIIQSDFYYRKWWRPEAGLSVCYFLWVCLFFFLILDYSPIKIWTIYIYFYILFLFLLWLQRYQVIWCQFGESFKAFLTTFSNKQTEIACFM